MTSQSHTTWSILHCTALMTNTTLQSSHSFKSPYSFTLREVMNLWPSHIFASNDSSFQRELTLRLMCIFSKNSRNLILLYFMHFSVKYSLEKVHELGMDRSNTTVLLHTVSRNPPRRRWRRVKAIPPHRRPSFFLCVMRKIHLSYDLPKPMPFTIVWRQDWLCPLTNPLQHFSLKFAN